MHCGDYDCGRRSSTRSSRLEVETESDLVTTGVEVLSLDQRRQRHLNARAEGLGVREADLGVIVDLGGDGGVAIDGVFGCESEARGGGALRPGELNAGAQSWRHLLEQGSREVGSIVEEEIDGEVSCVVTEGEVGLGKFGCRRVKGQLSAGHPVAVTQNRRRVDGRTAKVQIHVSVDVDEVAGIGSFDLSGLFARLRRHGGLEGKFEAGRQLVLDGDLGRQQVIGRPFLGQRQSVLLDVQLGLQAGAQLAGVELGVAAGGEVDAGRSQRLHFHLHAAIIEALAEQVAGGLAEISIRWRDNHFDLNVRKLLRKTRKS